MSFTEVRVQYITMPQKTFLSNILGDKMVIGYVLSANTSNEGIFFSDDLPEGILCGNCGTCLDYNYTPAFIEINYSKQYDVSYTHDLRDIFSLQFVKFCIDVLDCKDEFKHIKSGSFQFHYLFPKSVLEFDFECRKTKFQKYCSICGGYESIVGAYPVYLKIKELLGPGFFRTDIAFGSGISKFPLIIVGEEWKNILSKQKFRG